MKKILTVLALVLGSQLSAQEAPSSILEFGNIGNSEFELYGRDTVVYVQADINAFNAFDVEETPNRVDNDEDGVYSFYDCGGFSLCEVRKNDGRVLVSIVRYR